MLGPVLGQIPQCDEFQEPNEEEEEGIGIEELNKGELECWRDVEDDSSHGACQKSALETDVYGTLSRYYHNVHEKREDILSRECTWMKNAKVDVVVSDVVAIACRAAYDAGVPCACLSNFTWDFIYQHMLEDVHSLQNVSASAINLWQDMVEKMRKDYACCSVYLKLPGSCPVNPSLSLWVVNVPLISRRAMMTKAAVASYLGLKPHIHTVLCMFGGHDPGSEFQITENFIPDGWVCLMSGSTCMEQLPHNVIKLPKDAHLPDIVNYCDAVIGKLGYGTVSECIQHQTPLIFVRRKNFAEEEFMEALLREHSCGVEMTISDLKSGAWHTSLKKSTEIGTRLGEKTNIQCDGANVCSQMIEALWTLHESVRPVNDPTSNGYQVDEWKNFCSHLLKAIKFGDNTQTQNIGNVPFPKIFTPKHAIHVNRSPGRLDVMGGIADYSGSHVLEMTIGEGTYVASQKVERKHGGRGSLVQIVSPSSDGNERSESVKFDMSNIMKETSVDVSFLEYEEIQRYFNDYKDPWIAYVIGCIVVLVKEKKIKAPKASSIISILVYSAVPEGKGVSSSAAIEIASLVSLGSLFGARFKSSQEVAIMGQKVENLVVGRLLIEFYFVNEYLPGYHGNMS